MAELEFNIARLQQCLDVTVGTPSVGDVLTVSSTSPLEFDFGPNGGGTGTVNYVDGNDPISVDNTDPANPVINIAIADKNQAGVVNDQAQEWWGVKTFDSLPVSFVDPIDPEQLTTKKYVDTFAAGLQVKAAVRAATLEPGTLASSFENGDIIDEVTLATGDRILIKNQTNAVENGIFTVNASGAPTRATDYDALGEANVGTFTTVTEGGQKNTQWVQVNTGTPTPGTDALNFSRLNISGNVNTIQSPNTAHGAGGTLTGAVTLDSTDIYYNEYSGNTVKQEMVTVSSVGGNPQIITGNKKFNGSVDLTGSVATATTQTTGNNTTRIATTAFVQNSLANSITGGASTIRTANLTINRALISNGLGKVAISPTTSSELAFVSGVTSPIQAQINNKLDSTTAAATYAPIASPTFTGSPTVSGPVITPSTDSSDKIATTAFVQSAIQNIGDISITYTLTASDILNIYSTAKLLPISAPGPGKILRVTLLTYRLRNNTIAWIGSNLYGIGIMPTSLSTGAANNNNMQMYFNVIGSTTQLIGTGIPAATPVTNNRINGGYTSIVENDTLSLKGFGIGNLLGGDGIIDVYISYRIITL